MRDSAYEERQFIVAEVDGDDFLPVADRAGRVRRFKTRVKAIALADKLNLAIHAVAGVDKQL
nr:hypothetical protein [Xanthomonas campestris pv. campestris]